MTFVHTINIGKLGLWCSSMENMYLLWPFLELGRQPCQSRSFLLVFFSLRSSWLQSVQKYKVNNKYLLKKRKQCFWIQYSRVSRKRLWVTFCVVNDCFYMFYNSYFHLYFFKNNKIVLSCTVLYSILWINVPS